MGSRFPWPSAIVTRPWLQQPMGFHGFGSPWASVASAALTLPRFSSLLATAHASMASVLALPRLQQSSHGAHLTRRQRPPTWHWTVVVARQNAVRTHAKQRPIIQPEMRIHGDQCHRTLHGRKLAPNDCSRARAYHRNSTAPSPGRHEVLVPSPTAEHHHDTSIIEYTTLADHTAHDSHCTHSTGTTQARPACDTRN